MSMADINKNFNIVDNGNFGLGQVIKDYTIDINNDVNHDMLLSTVISSAIWKASLFIPTIDYMTMIK